ncbi:MAG: AMP-binding protein, partial [Chlamydiia bacterium]|nr:AMP-binding protein [Chlamydiia bacterium]
LGLGKEDVWLHALPDFHVAGVGIYARCALLGNKVLKHQEEWSAATFVKMAEKATISALVPTQVHDLVQGNYRSPPSMRMIVVGGGRLNPYLQDRAWELGWRLLPSYGLTECSSQVATALPDKPRELVLLPHVECSLRKGFLAIKSGSLLTVAARFSPHLVVEDPKVEGALVTEDRASLQGRALKVYGRDKDYIKVGGEGVSLLELDALLEQLMQEFQIDHDCALFAPEDERLGNVIRLATTKISLRLYALVEEFQTRVLPFERIRGIVQVDAIPRTPLGKIRRAEI